MSIDQSPFLRPNPHPTKAFCGEGRSCVIDSSTLDELIDRKSATMQAQVHGQRILKIAGDVLRGSAAKDFFMNRHPKSKLQTFRVWGHLRFGSWSFLGAWDLELGAFRAMFGPRAQRPFRTSTQTRIWNLFTFSAAAEPILSATRRRTGKRSAI
jgi:hypothetical protein